MPVKIRSVHVPATTVINGAIEYNPNRIKLILSTQYQYDVGQGLMRLFVPPYEVPQTGTGLFPLWGGCYDVAAGYGSGPPAYLYLEGEMAKGPWGVMNPDPANSQWFYVLEETKTSVSPIPIEAPGMDVKEEEPELKLRQWGPFVW